MSFPLFSSLGSDLTICFETSTSVPHLMKVLTPQELESVKMLFEAFETSFAARLVVHPHVVPLKLIRTNIIVMPLFPSTAEHLHNFNDTTALKFLKQVGDALAAFHTKGLAHNDLKPSNIFINAEGHFILGDIGSTAKFGQVTPSTQVFIPKDLRGSLRKASAQKDFWMLSMCLYDRTAPHEDLRLGSAHDPTSAQVLEALRSRSTTKDLLSTLLSLLNVPLPKPAVSASASAPSESVVVYSPFRHFKKSIYQEVEPTLLSFNEASSAAATATSSPAVASTTTTTAAATTSSTSLLTDSKSV